MRKQIIIFLLTVLTLTVQGQVSKKVPEHIVNHKMNMDVPLPEPSFEIDSTTVRLHILNWNAAETFTNTACLTTMSFFPYMAENYTSSISNDGIAIIRFLQKGTSRACISINNAFSKKFYLYPGETADIYIDLQRMAETSQNYMSKKIETSNCFFNQKDTLKAEQIERHIIVEEYGFDKQPCLWFEGHYADLNTALHRYMPFTNGFGWDMNFEKNLTLNQPLANTYVEEMIKWHDYLKQHIAQDTRLPLCAKQLCSLAIDIQAEQLLWGNAQVLDIIAAQKDGAAIGDYIDNRPLTEQQIALFHSLGTNTNYRAYFSSMDLPDSKKEWDAVSGNNPCDYLHDMRIVKSYPRHIELYGKLQDGAMKNVKMQYFHKICQQLETAQVGIEHYTYSDILEDIKHRYKGKVVLIDFWATWCHGCIVSMKAMEELKDSTLKHPELAFVYLTDQTSSPDRWQEYRKKIRGEHILANEQQMEELKKCFNIQYLPTYIIMNREGQCREVSKERVEEELLKELNK